MIKESTRTTWPPVTGTISMKQVIPLISFHIVMCTFFYHSAACVLYINGCSRYSWIRDELWKWVGVQMIFYSVQSSKSNQGKVRKVKYWKVEIGQSPLHGFRKWKLLRFLMKWFISLSNPPELPHCEWLNEAAFFLCLIQLCSSEERTNRRFPLSLWSSSMRKRLREPHQPRKLR